MEIAGIGILSWITFLPVVGMVIVLMLPKEKKDWLRWTALVVAALALFLLWRHRTNFAGLLKP